MSHCKLYVMSFTLMAVSLLLLLKWSTTRLRLVVDNIRLLTVGVMVNEPTFYLRIIVIIVIAPVTVIFVNLIIRKYE